MIHMILAYGPKVISVSEPVGLGQLPHQPDHHLPLVRPHWLFLRLSLDFLRVKRTISPDLVSDESLKEMVANLVMFQDIIDVGSHNCFFFSKNSDGAIHLYVRVLRICEIPKCDRNLVLALVVENYLEETGRIVYFQDCAH